MGTKVFAVLFTQAVNDHKTDPEAPILEDADLQVLRVGQGWGHLWNIHLMINDNDNHYRHTYDMVKL